MTTPHDATFPRRLRLRGEKAIEELFRQGKGGFVYPFRYVVMTGDRPPGGAAGAAGYRILISVPKRYHKRANRRNLLKRRAREAFRQSKNSLAAGREPGKELRIALVYSSGEVESYRKIENAIGKIISQLNKTE